MKLFLYAFLMNGVFNRYRTIKSKEKARLERFNEAKEYIFENGGIPVDYILGGVCEILKIKATKGAKDLVFEMCLGVYNDEELVKKLPLVW